MVWYRLKQRDTAPIAIIRYGNHTLWLRKDFYFGNRDLDFSTYRGGMKNNMKQPRIPPVKLRAV